MDINKTANDSGVVRPEVAQIVTVLYQKDLAARRKEEYQDKLMRLRQISKQAAVAQDLEAFEAAIAEDNGDTLVDIEYLRQELANRLSEVDTPKTSIETATWMSAFGCRPYARSLSCDPPTQEERDILYLEYLVTLK